MGIAGAYLYLGWAHAIAYHQDAAIGSQQISTEPGSAYDQGQI